MDKINVNSLFNIPTQCNQPLSVKTLFNPDETKQEREGIFNVECLIESKKERRQKVIAEYKKIHNICLRKIKSVNRMNKDDFVFEIPLAIFRCPDYNPAECLEHLEERLKRLQLDTLILSNNKIFISWKNLEMKRSSPSS